MKFPATAAAADWRASKLWATRTTTMWSRLPNCRPSGAARLTRQCGTVVQAVRPRQQSDRWMNPVIR